MSESRDDVVKTLHLSLKTKTEIDLRIHITAQSQFFNRRSTKISCLKS